MKVDATKRNVKKHWESLYGPITGSFENGLILQTINSKGNLISLTDGTNWSVVVVGNNPHIIRLKTAAWTTGNNMSINRKDGIIINRSIAGVWVKVRPFHGSP